MMLVLVLLDCPDCYPFPLLPIGSLLPPLVILLHLYYIPLRSPPILVAVSLFTQSSHLSCSLPLYSVLPS